MQIVGPIDVEEAVAAELLAVLPSGTTVTAYPPPDNLAPATVSVMSLGSYEQSAVTDWYDLVVYVWASTYSEAYAMGLSVADAIRALRFNATQTHFNTSEANAPYEDPDPDRQTLRRCTVRATVGVRGVGMTLQ